MLIWPYLEAVWRVGQDVLQVIGWWLTPCAALVVSLFAFRRHSARIRLKREAGLASAEPKQTED